MIRLLALYQTPAEQAFFETLTDHFAYLADWQLEAIKPDLSLNEASYQAVVAFTSLKTPLPLLDLSSLGLVAEPFDWGQVSTVLELAKHLTLLVQESQLAPLAHLPYQASYYSPTGQLLYTNGRPQDLFDVAGETPAESQLSSWILEQIKDRPHHSCHLQIPALSNEHILTMSYQGCYDEAGRLTGILQMVQNSHPLLESYLAETGQALVGWSDVTSGASIHNDRFDY